MNPRDVRNNGSASRAKNGVSEYLGPLLLCSPGPAGLAWIVYESLADLAIALVISAIAYVTIAAVFAPRN
ncbi:hypothetical protein GON01_02695 [Sphingomonas sp. MAH-20]|uniref:Uncharacterized protein n=1 Tax=Sphingomonas horti TaxID=2682842 RepID=A0A6I4IXM5_9SPHN|nr:MULTISPECIES: hypothetical protein [Sphingomonas]MBA2920861.1 hypothetical protein [Sphingomonas sp. CGMCC 1.13658]MVO76847.1 hypothetical protein [Sphingomonas horti]